MEKQKPLTSTMLALLAITAIVNIRNLPILAAQGWHGLFYYAIAAICYLIPSALICSELSSRFPENGGLYAWVKLAFGPRLGFFTIWLEWINNLISVPITLSFIAATLLYLINPHLSTHPTLLFMLILVLLWGGIFYNFLSIKQISVFTSFGAIVGTIIPVLALIILASFSMWHGTHYLPAPTATHILPTSWHLSTFVVLIAVMDGFAGMQILSFHAQDVKNPQRTFPRAIAIATVGIVLLSISGSLAIALVIPKERLSLLSGTIQSFHVFFHDLHWPMLTIILGLCLIIGALANFSAWLLGPARGMQVAASDGHLPTWFAHTNDKHMPTHMLIGSGIVGTVFASVFLWLHSLNAAFWLLMVMTSQLTLLMYCLLFASSIKLRNHPKARDNAFQIPGGRIGLWGIAGMAMLCAASACLLGFIPPNSGPIHNTEHFVLMLMIANACYLGLPVLITKYCGRLRAHTHSAHLTK